MSGNWAAGSAPGDWAAHHSAATQSLIAGRALLRRSLADYRAGLPAPQPQGATVPQPSIGRIVHYVSYGTPGGEYGKECRAAIVTELTGDPDHPDQVGLAVLNPTGYFFNRAVQHHDGAETPGSPDCPDSETHGNPFHYCFHYCACGWAEAAHVGGTWHWPERTEA